MAMEQGPLLRFLVALTEQPTLLQSVRTEFERVMEKQGLSEEQREAVLSGDLGRIQQALIDEGDDIANLIFVPMWHLGGLCPPRTGE